MLYCAAPGGFTIEISRRRTDQSPGGAARAEPPDRSGDLDDLVPCSVEDPQASRSPSGVRPTRGRPDVRATLVTFAIESYRDIVKLTITQAQLRSMDQLRAVGEGWPSVLANLKTLLETGEVLPQAPGEFHADERAARMAKNG